MSLSVSLFVLLALYAPTQLPSGARQGWAADALLRSNPVTAAEHYISAVVINQHGWTQDAAWLISPAVASAARPAPVKPGAVAVSLDRANLSIPLGEGFRLASRISNVGRTPVSGL